MARKSWSYVFFLVGLLLSALALLPHNRLWPLEGILVLICCVMGIALRKTMLVKTRKGWNLDAYQSTKDEINNWNTAGRFDPR